MPHGVSFSTDMLHSYPVLHGMLKFSIAAPIAFHFANGIRHLVRAGGARCVYFGGRGDGLLT